MDWDMITGPLEWWGASLFNHWFCLLNTLWFILSVLVCFIKGWIKWICTRFVWPCSKFYASRSVGMLIETKVIFDGDIKISNNGFSRVWIFMILCSGIIRYGEALNPGPIPSGWSLGTFNPSGLTSKADILSTIDGDVWGVTETHLSYEGFRKFRHGLACNKSPFDYCIPGAHCPLRKRSQEVGSFSGVMCLSKWPVRALPHCIDAGLFKTARTQIYGICIHQLWITCGVIYGFPDSVSHQYPKFQTELLLEQVIDRVALQCRGPRVIMGDFNWLSSDLSQLRRLESLGFRDLQTLAQEWWGIVPKPTGRGERIIDFVYISPELFPLLTSVTVDPTQWPDHSSVVGRFKGGHDSIRELRWKIPTKVDWPTGEWIAEWPRPTGDVSADFALSWASIESNASTARACQGLPPYAASQLGRGQTLEAQQVVVNPTPIKKGRIGESQPRFFGGSWRYAQRYKQLRRLQCLVRLLRKNHDDITTEIWQLWKTIRWSSGYPHGFGAWWETYGVTLLHSLQHSDSSEGGNCPSPVAPGSVEDASWDGRVREPCLEMQIPWSPPACEIAQRIFEVVHLDVTSLEKSLIKTRYLHSKNLRARDLRYVFKDCAKDQPEPVALVHQSSEADIDFVEPDLGRIHLRENVRFGRQVPLVIQGQPFTLNAQHGNVLEVKEFVPDDLSGTVAQTVVHTSVDAILQAFHDEWAPRWQKMQQLEQSQWHQVFAFVKCKLPTQTWTFPEWTVPEFRRVVKNKKPSAAVGADGITRGDLIALPACAIDRMVQVFKTAESTAEWPQQLTVGIVNSLEKTPGSLVVTGFRPIVIYLLLYRIWSSFRSRQFLKQFLAIAPDGLRGGLPGCQAKSLWYEIAVALEHSHQVGSSVIGVVADLIKAFNAIPRLPVFQLLHHLGIPDWFIRTWGAFVSIQTRRFRIRGSVGKGIQSSSGFPEGCGLSVCAMTIIDMALDAWLMGLQVEPVVYTFVDDWQILHSSPEHHNQIIARLEFFVDALQMDLDKSKSFVWGSSSEARKFLRAGDLEVFDHSRNLGAQSNYTKRCGNRVLVKRLLAMPKTWKLFRSSIASYEKKAIALRMLAWPRALHGIAVVRLGKAHFETSRTQAIRGLRCDRIGAHPLLHLSTLGYTFDPEGWSLLQTFKDARDFCNSNHFQHLLLQSYFDKCSIPKNGPVAILRDRAESLGWRTTPDGLLSDEIGEFDFCEISIGSLQQRIAWSWPALIAREVAHRISFDGIQWADLGEVQQLFQVFSQTDQVYLRCAMDGTMYTRHGKQHWMQGDSHLCHWCREPDSYEHRLWKCSRFESCRKEIDPSVMQQVDVLPSCLKNHGWPVRSTAQVEFARALVAIPEMGRDDYQCDQCVGTSHDFFIDGACVLPTDRTCRLSAFAVTVAQPWISTWEHSLVVAGHVPGLEQSPFRAELWALFHAVQAATMVQGTVRIWTDCESLLGKVVFFQQSGCGIKINQAHADVWGRIVDMLPEVQGRLTFHKVVSHISPSGGSSEVEQWAFWHNGLVDCAASSINRKRSGEFDRVWRLCCQFTWSMRKISLALAKHIVKVGRIANESVPKSTMTERDAVREAKYGPKVNRIQIPSQLSVDQKFSNKYGTVFSQILLKWWLQTGNEYLKRDGNLRWISYTQLFCDFLLGTEHPGVFLVNGQWGADVASFADGQVPTFSQRSRWFQMALKAFWDQGGIRIITKLQRPSSSALACWLSSALILWDSTRLECIDAELHKQLGLVSRSIWLEQLGPFPHHSGMRLSGV